MANYLLPELKPAQVDLTQNFFKGMAAPMQAMAMENKNVLAQQQLQDYQERKNAFQQYGQSGDPSVIKGVDPEMHMKLKTWLDSQPPEVLKDLPRATATAQQIAPMLNSASWKGGLYQQFKQSFPNLPEGAIPGPDATDQQLYSWSNAAKLLDAQIKLMARDPKVVGRSLVTPTGKEIFRGPEPKTTILDRMGRPIGEVTGKAMQLHEPPHGLVPQWFADPDQPLTGDWVRPGERPPVNAAGKPYIPKTSVNQAGIESLSDDALRTQVDKAIQTGVDPSLGFGGGLRSKYFEMFNTRVKELGLTAGDIGTQKAVQASLRSALSGLEGQAAKINAFASNFDKNIGVAENLLEKKDPRTGVPIANKWIQAGKRSITGDPDIAALDVAVKTIANEFARLTTSATGGGQLAEEEIKKAEKLLAAAQSPEQMKAALRVMKADRLNREKSFYEQTNNLKERLRQPAGKVPGGQSAGLVTESGPPAAGVANYPEISKYKKVVSTPDGGIATLVGEQGGNPLYKWPDGTVRPRIQRK